MALALIITNAGRQALIDGETITHLAVGTSGYTATATATGLRNEVARVSVSGSSPVAGQLQIQAIDESANVYACRELGLITDQGTLFAIYAQSGVLIEKSSAAAVVITADLAISSEGAASITFGNTNFLQLSATTQHAGIVQLDDSYTSTSQTKAPTANALRSLYSWVANQLSGKAASSHGHSSGQISDFNAAIAGLFQQSLTQDGYCKLPGGLIIQWGRGQVSGGSSAVITYPIAFPSECFVAVPVAGGTGSGGGNYDYFGVSEITEQQFKVTSGYNGSQKVIWIAVGK